MTKTEYNNYRKRWDNDYKDFYYGHFPLNIDVETITTCNLKCEMCYQSFDPLKYGKMKDKTFYKILKEAEKYKLSAMKLQFRNEPLMDKRLPEFITDAKNVGILDTMINTNATLLNNLTSMKLIVAGLDKLSCSVDGYIKKDYESIRIGAKFETTLANIKNFMALRKEVGTDKPVVDCKTIPFKGLDIKKYKRFWGRIVDNAGVLSLFDLRQKEDFTVKPDFICPDFWRRLIVLYNGDVVPCCHAIRGNTVHMTLGNIHNTSLYNMWHGRKLNKLRDLFKEGKSHKIYMCRMCDIRTQGGIFWK